MLVPSTDGVEVAVHELSSERLSGQPGAPFLVSHATGFHGRCYQPVADALADTARCIAFDYRGHGDTRLPARHIPGTIDWHAYGDDALAMTKWLVDQAGGPIVAFGHSMGGACLLMAAHRDPTLFRRIVAFEPIVFPPLVYAEGVEADDVESPMVAGARRRRSSFLSFDEAIANFSSKPPLNAFTPAALDAYVRHGFAAGPDGAVHLKCGPNTEADTYASGGSHDTWALLPEIRTDVLVISGRVEAMGPSTIAAQVAERLPNGRYLQRDDMDHFGPMSHPQECAEIIRAELTS